MYIPEHTTLRETIESLIQQNITANTQKHRMNESLNLKLLSCDEEQKHWVDFLYELREEHMNPYGGLHGGIACALLDTCGGMSAAAVSGKLPTTTDLSCSYLRPVTGKHCRVHIELTFSGNKLVGESGQIFDHDSDALCITGMMKYMLLNKDPGQR